MVEQGPIDFFSAQCLAMTFKRFKESWASWTGLCFFCYILRNMPFMVRHPQVYHHKCTEKKLQHALQCFRQVENSHIIDLYILYKHYSKTSVRKHTFMANQIMWGLQYPL